MNASSLETPHKRELNVALIQMTSGGDLEQNLDFLIKHITLAAQKGAEYIQTPENSLFMELDPKKVAHITQAQEYTQALKELFQCAAAHKVWLHIGSIASPLSEKRTNDKGHALLANRSYLIGPEYSATQDQQGLYFYDKIHMFDVTLPNGEHYQESASYAPGEKALVVECDFNDFSTKLGMTICYDLRFPALYRHLALEGAEMISVPAAFTQTTGEAHWHVLLRARAIETGCFILASGQTGLHENGRSTFGHSLIISPWGEVLLDAGREPGVYHKTIDLSEVQRVRQIVPSLNHGKLFQ